MGLTKRTEDFFTNRINKILDERLAEINEGIDTDEVERVSKNLFFDKYECGIDLEARQARIEELKKAVEEEEELLGKEAKKVLKATNTPFSYWVSDSIKNALVLIKTKMYWEALILLYPKAVPQIEEIDRLREDVQGTVLLATTERKLVNALSQLVENYGGSISGLLDLLPRSVEDLD